MREAFKESGLMEVVLDEDSLTLLVKNKDGVWSEKTATPLERAMLSEVHKLRKLVAQVHDCAIGAGITSRHGDARASILRMTDI